jgi:hypothetical protein
MSFGVMKDYNLKLRNLHPSHTVTGWYDFALRGGDENSIIKNLDNVAGQSVNTRLNSHKDC